MRDVDKSDLAILLEELEDAGLGVVAKNVRDRIREKHKVEYELELQIIEAVMGDEE